MTISNSLTAPHWPIRNPVNRPSQPPLIQQAAPSSAAAEVRPGSRPANPTGQNLLHPTTTAALLVAQEEAGAQSASAGQRSMMSGADAVVRDKWDNAEKETGYNPLTDSTGKIVGSAFLASYMAMEYRLSTEFGPEQARNTMANVFSDPDTVSELMKNALDRARSPLDGSKSPAQLQREIDFYQAYLKPA